MRIDDLLGKHLSRSMLGVLRHHPEQYALRMDKDGWVDALDFGKAINQIAQCVVVCDCDSLKKLVLELDLQDRIEFHTNRCKAMYGHSTSKFSPANSQVPAAPIFHGTSTSRLSTIESYGLLPMHRRFVQLTTDYEYASRVAAKYGDDPMVMQVVVDAATRSGTRFYPTSTHVWLSTEIPAEALELGVGRDFW